MSGDNLLKHLENETLPEAIVEAFMTWCIWEQGRAALIHVLETAGLKALAEPFAKAGDFAALVAACTHTVDEVNKIRHKTGALTLSAASTATFEYGNLLKAASDAERDPVETAFFAVRVCGWAGWAAGDYADPAQKTAAEEQARRDQAAYLDMLWKNYNKQQK